jgi:hypothetical protein
MLTDEIIRAARRKLLIRARSIRNAEFNNAIEHQFTAQQILDGVAAQAVVAWLVQSLGDRITRPVLYSLSVADTETAEAIVNAFDGLLTEQERGYRLPRRNPRSEGQTTLYVGGSENVRRRLREHIGSAPRATYAMNMQQWCPMFDGMVTVSVQSFSPEVTRDCRQDLEDTLWDSLQPIFGKRGAR